MATDWRKENFEGMAQLLGYLTDKPKLQKYREYCGYSEKGHRREALHAIKAFLKETATWDFQERKEFVDWIMWVHHGLPEVQGLLPSAMYLELIEPTLSEWMANEPKHSGPYRWSGGEENLRKAIALDKLDGIAIMKFGKMILNATNYSLHELPETYLGEPQEDSDDLEEALGYLSGALGDPGKDALMESLKANADRIRKWILKIEE